MMIWVNFTIVFLVASVISELRSRKWWVKGWNAARFHLAVFMVMLAIIGVFLPQKSLILVTLLIVGALFHFSRIYRFTPFHECEVPKVQTEKSTITFLTANVRMSNRRTDKLLDFIKKHNPDVLLLTETDQYWVHKMSVLSEDYPHQISQPQDNTYGMALYSKLPLQHSKVRFLVEEDVPSIDTQIDFNGQSIQFIGLHPRPPAPWNDDQNKDFELIKVAGMTNWNNHPSVVSGDLNDVGWSDITKQFQSISGLLDPRVGRGFYNTYNALIPVFRIPIDHFFVSKHFKLVEMRRLGHFGSDHFPVLLKVCLT
jgi:endonuclease/exonuclease/phosphatase (EEP) superfamily protein YafD